VTRYEAISDSIDGMVVFATPCSHVLPQKE